MSDHLFESASRQKLRFESPKGLLSVEDLWDLPLTAKAGSANLDDVARQLHRHIKEAEGDVSFVRPPSQTSNDLQLKFDVVKHVIDVRVTERDAAAQAADKAAKKQKILEILAKKQDASLEAASEEDLRKMLDQI